jgi:hypothetical protein
MPGGRAPGSGVALAVGAAAVKLTIGLGLPFVIIAAAAGRRERARGRIAAAAGVAVIAVGIPTVALFGAHFVDQLHRISTDPLFDTLFSGPDRLAVALGTHITPAIRATCTGAAALAAIAALVWVLRGGDAITGAGWAFLALIASIASLAPWYLVWLMPLAALSASRRLRCAALVATLYLVAVHLPALGGLPYLQAPGKPNPAAGQLAQAPPERSAHELRNGESPG